MLTTTVTLPGAVAYESQMNIHTSTANTKTSLSRELQKNLSDLTRSHGFLDHVKDRKRAS